MTGTVVGRGLTPKSMLVVGEEDAGETARRFEFGSGDELRDDEEGNLTL